MPVFVQTILEHFYDPAHWIGAIFYAVVFLFVAIILSRVVKLAANRVLLRAENALIDPTVVLFLTQLIQIGIYIIGLIIYFHIIPALNKLGTALLTGVSVMSVVFGLAAQNTLSNLVAGCTLLLYRPFHIDDLIQVATPTGTEIGVVERLTLGYTMLRTTDDRLVIVPNSLMASQVSLNLNRRHLHAMAIVSIGVLDASRLGDVRQALSECAAQNKRIHRIISEHAQRLDDNSAVLTLRAWCGSDDDAKAVQMEVMQALQTRFADKHLIVMPPLPAEPKPATPTALS